MYLRLDARCVFSSKAWNLFYAKVQMVFRQLFLSVDKETADQRSMQMA